MLEGWLGATQGLQGEQLHGVGLGARLVLAERLELGLAWRPALVDSTRNQGDSTWTREEYVSRYRALAGIRHRFGPGEAPGFYVHARAGLELRDARYELYRDVDAEIEHESTHDLSWAPVFSPGLGGFVALGSPRLGAELSLPVAWHTKSAIQLWVDEGEPTVDVSPP